MSRLLAGPLTAGLLVLIAPAVAFAHGVDSLAYQGISGPYLISVFDARPAGQPGKAEYRLVLTEDPGDGQLGQGAGLKPVSQARVTVVDPAGHRHVAESSGHVYSMLLEDRDQNLDISISGPPGATSLRVDVHALTAPAQVRSYLVPVATGAGVTTLLGAVALVLVRRRAALPAAGASGQRNLRLPPAG